MVEPSKKDWKLYKEKIGGWQEHYMEKLVKEYADYLCSDLPASTKFWEIEKRIKRDRKMPGVCIELTKSDMFWDIATETFLLTIPIIPNIQGIRMDITGYIIL